MIENLLEMLNWGTFLHFLLKIINQILAVEVSLICSKTFYLRNVTLKKLFSRINPHYYVHIMYQVLLLWSFDGDDGEVISNSGVY